MRLVVPPLGKLPLQTSSPNRSHSMSKIVGSMRHSSLPGGPQEAGKVGERLKHVPLLAGAA